MKTEAAKRLAEDMELEAAEAQNDLEMGVDGEGDECEDFRMDEDG